MVSIRLLDAAGQPVSLGREVGRGGEGAVWETQRPGLVAKVYHHAIDAAKADKLAALAGAARPELLAVAAWPTTTLHAVAGGPIVGVLMPFVGGHVELHQLYSPVHRRLHFPDRDWSFLVHVAMNCAAAVETVHDAGHVIGDLNQKGVLVNPQGTVHLIDCDSFQIRAGTRLFRCEVGVPELTPPELQGVSFRAVDRTPSHDCFGLALLIFHLLFMGRHPYRGRFGGAGDMTIERAIGEGRFAFSRHAASYQMGPPPGTIEMNSIPGAIADLFETAFAPIQSMPNRPTAAQWRIAMGGLKQRLHRCHVDTSHVYPDSLADCVWCAMETRGGPAFFSSVSASASFDGGFNLLTVWNRIATVRRPPAPMAFARPKPPRNITPVPMPMHTNWEALGLPASLPRPLKSPLVDLPSLPKPFVPEGVPDDPIWVEEPVPTVPAAPLDNYVAAVDAAFRRPRSKLLQYLFPGSYAYQVARRNAEAKSQMHRQYWPARIAEAMRERERVIAHNSARRTAWETECARLRHLRSGLSERNAKRRTQWEAEILRITELRDAFTKQNSAVAEKWHHDVQVYEAAKREAEAHNALIAAARTARQQEIHLRQQRFETLMNAIESLPRTWAGEAVAFNKRYEDAVTRLRTARGEYETLRAAFESRKAALSHGQQEAQLRDHLDRALIDDARISGLGAGRKAKLAAYGIETALDARTQNLYGVPGFGDVLVLSILSWVNDVEQGFVPDPKRGIPIGEIQKLHTAFHARRIALQRELQAGVETLQAICGSAEKRLNELQSFAAARVSELAQAEADASVS